MARPSTSTVQAPQLPITDFLRAGQAKVVAQGVEQCAAGFNHDRVPAFGSRTG